MTEHDITKRAALALLRRGLITKSEAARLAGISRQLMGHWAKDIRSEEAREAVLMRLWRSQTKKRQ